MQAGEPVRLSMPVYSTMNGGVLPKGLEARERAMTLENLLTQSSGFYCDDEDPKAPGRENTMTDDSQEPDYYKYTMAVPMAHDPGKVSVYCSANPNLAISVLWRATGEHPMDLFDRLLGDPLMIARDAWPLSPALQPYGGGGVQMLPRDFMKLAQLMLNGAPGTDVAS
jgi:CubicO group peptidase (beta-lactamase class C family)